MPTVSRNAMFKIWKYSKLPHAAEVSLRYLQKLFRRKCPVLEELDNLMSDTEPRRYTAIYLWYRVNTKQQLILFLSSWFMVMLTFVLSPEVLETGLSNHFRSISGHFTNGLFIIVPFQIARKDIKWLLSPADLLYLLADNLNFLSLCRPYTTFQKLWGKIDLNFFSSTNFQIP